MVFWYFCDFYKIIHLQVGVTIRLSSSGLTKICTFTPFYIVMNTSDVTMWVAEAKEEEDWIELPPKSVNRKNILSDQSQWINKTFIISKLAVTMFPLFFQDHSILCICISLISFLVYTILAFAVWEWNDNVSQSGRIKIQN